MGHAVNYLLGLMLLLSPQNPSLDSGSPRERQAAIEKMAVVGNRDAIPQQSEVFGLTYSTLNVV